MAATRASVLVIVLAAQVAAQYVGYDPPNPPPVLSLTTGSNNVAFASQGFDGRGVFYLDGALTVKDLPVWKHAGMDFFLHLNSGSYYILTRTPRASVAAAATADGSIYCPQALDHRWPNQMTCQWMYRTDIGVTAGWASSLNIQVRGLTAVPDQQVLYGLPSSFWDAQGFDGTGRFVLLPSTTAQGWPVWKHVYLDFYLYVTGAGRYKFARALPSSLEGSDDGIISCPSSMSSRWPFEMVEAWQRWDGASWVTDSSIRVAQSEDATSRTATTTTATRTSAGPATTTPTPTPTTDPPRIVSAARRTGPQAAKALGLALLCWQARSLAAPG